MEIREVVYDNSEYKVIAEKLHSMKYNKDMLKLALDEEEFKYKYILKREDKTVTGVSARLVLNFPIMFIAVNLLIVLVELIIYSVELKGFVLIAGLFFLILIGVLVYRYKKDTNNKLIIERSVLDKIARLKIQIKRADNDINVLTKKKQAIEMTYQENMLAIENDKQQEEVKKQETKQPKEVAGTFKIKKQLDEKDAIEEKKRQDAEIARLNKEIDKLKKEESELKYKILAIDYDYEIVNESIFRFISVLITMVVAQPIFTGVMKHVIPVIYLVVSLVYFFYLVKVCKEPLIMYLVEHKKKIIQDYAFCNNLYPLSDRLDQIKEEINYCIREITYIKKDEL